MIDDRRPLSWWFGLALGFVVGDYLVFRVIFDYPWVDFGLAAAFLACWVAVLTRPARWSVVVRGNSATNDGEVLSRTDFFSRWGARRKARVLNSLDPTGTGILTARVERKLR